MWCFLSFLCPPHYPWAISTLIRDSDSQRLKHFKGKHFCWTLLGSFTSVGHMHFIYWKEKVPSSSLFMDHWRKCCPSHLLWQISKLHCNLPGSSSDFAHALHRDHLFLPNWSAPLDTSSSPTQNPSLPVSTSSFVSCMQLIILQIIQRIHKLEEKPHVINSSFLNHELKIEMQGKIRDTSMNK